MNTKLKNQLSLVILCCILGAFSGVVIWGFLKLVSEGTVLLWEWLPGKVNVPFYTVIVCTVGGFFIGLFRKRYGDYPEELNVVLGKVKQEKHYDYKKYACYDSFCCISASSRMQRRPGSGYDRNHRGTVLLGRR